MGTFLTKPIETKITDEAENKNFKVAASCMQGWRMSMEDAHCMHLTMPNKPDTGLFGVFDGHGGALVAQSVASCLLQKLEKEPLFSTNVNEAFRRGFMRLDDDLRAQPNILNSGAGCTAVVVMIDASNNRLITCANIGDSRAIVSVKGRAVYLSQDHKPNNMEEHRRIMAAGGSVHANRVDGNLALSRAFGDFEFKRDQNLPKEHQKVIALPDVLTEDLTPAHEFVFIACDGIWDVMSNQAVVDFIRPRLMEGRSPGEVLEAILSHCLSDDCELNNGVGTDNMTAILVCLLQEQSYSAFVQRLKGSPPSSYLKDPGTQRYY